MTFTKFCARNFTGLLLLVLSVGLAQAAVFNPKTKTLENGMQVVVVENHRAPVVTNMVWYKVGAMDEPPGKSGLAHFLEHLMFKGTKNLAPGEFSATVARNGGTENAFTTQDYTAYHQSIASDRLELVIKLEAERMVNLRLTPEDIEPERQVVLEERRSRVENNPGARLSEQAMPALYFNHPYRIPVIGWAHEIKGLSQQDIVNFYKTYYAPNNAILVVAGDVKPEKVFALAEKYFGPLPAVDLPERPTWVEPPHEADREVTLRDARVTQPSWSYRMFAPGYHSDDPKRGYALEVLADILSSGSTSRLYRALVVEQKLATSAGAWYDPDQRGPALFGFYLSPREGTDINAVKTALWAEVDRLVKDGLTQEEVDRSIRRMQDNAVLALDSLSRPARTLGAALAIGMTIDDVENWPDRISEVTLEDVNRAARDLLSDHHGGLETRLLPAEKASSKKEKGA